MSLHINQSDHKKFLCSIINGYFTIPTVTVEQFMSIQDGSSMYKGAYSPLFIYAETDGFYLGFKQSTPNNIQDSLGPQWINTPQILPGFLGLCTHKSGIYPTTSKAILNIFHGGAHLGRPAVYQLSLIWLVVR